MKSKAPRLSAVEPLVARAAELFRHGDPAGAEALCRSALAADPRSAMALHLLGVLALQRQDTSQALQHFDTALKFSPRDAFVLIDRARAYEALGQADKALLSLAKAEAAARDAPAALLAAAGGCERLGALERAEALYLRITALAPGLVDAWIGLGNVRSRSSRYAEAEVSYRRAEALQPDHPGLLGNLGNLAQARGELAAAESLYRRAIDAEPRNALANYNLAQLLFDTHRADEAYSCFTMAMVLQPDFVEPAVKLAALTADRGQLREALEMYARIEESQPDCIEARYLRGLTLLGLDRLEEARAHFQRFALERPEVALAHAGLGNALMRLGRLVEAEEAFRAALACDPSSTEARLDLFEVLFQRGCEAEADTVVEQWQVDNPALLNRGLGETHLLHGRSSKALPYYQTLARLDPAAVDARARIGEIHLLRGEPSPAAWAGFGEWVRRARATPDGSATSLPDLDSLLGRGDRSNLLVKTEQGIGDELFFLRFARIAADRGIRVLFQASDKVAQLLKPRPPAFVDVFAPHEALPPVAASVRITDLPLLLRHPDQADRFPGPVALAATQDRLTGMRERLAQLGPPPYIGVTWRGGGESKLDWLSRGVQAFSKSIGPGRLGTALCGFEGTVLVLQRLPEADDLHDFQGGLDRSAPDLSAINEDLESMLALLGLLDDYIGVSNTNMHLLAGLGRTGRVLVPCPPEWRWLEAGSESPWFPGFRIYRQAPSGDWSAALTALRNDLMPGVPIPALSELPALSAMSAQSAAAPWPDNPPTGDAHAEPTADADGTSGTASVLISAEYLRMQEALHRDPNYGVASVEFAPTVAEFIRAHGVCEMLDYGAGKGRLGQTLRGILTAPLSIKHYEPAVAAWSARPAPAEFVACIDVLEHIEPDLLENVLDELKRVVKRWGMFTIATGPARKILSDGRNAHLIQQPSSWWLPKLMARFELAHFSPIPRGFLVVVERKT